MIIGSDLVKDKLTIKNCLIIGVVLIIIAITIGIIFRNDIAFIFAGSGTVIIGISILRYINKGDK